MTHGQGESPKLANDEELAVDSEDDRNTLPRLNRSLPKAPEDPLIGRVLRNTHRIVAPLDEGGMGKLYRAEHLRLRRPVW